MEKQTLSYPIGEYQPAESISSGQKQEWINALEHAPAKLKQAVRAMSDSQLDTPYREGDGLSAKWFTIWRTAT